MTDQQRRGEEARNRLSGKPVPVQEELGTPKGLLYNELIHNPRVALQSLLAMFEATKPLRSSSVYSRDASFLIYMLELAVDVEAYVLHVLTLETSPEFASSGESLQTILKEYQLLLRTFLGDKVLLKVLSRWWDECQEVGDVNTACVVAAYRALTYSNLEPTTMAPEQVSDMLASFLFCRNWHGFGLGLQVSQMHIEETEGMRPQDRLRRFLQAYGLDTSRLKEDDLDKYIKGKPLFLNLGGVTVRAPTLSSAVSH